MIVSVSRRTDIPAFYSAWFMNRLRDGFVLVPHPGDPVHFRRVTLDPAVVDCIVFWTKNPDPLLPRLDEITSRGYSFYFQFTITPYGSSIETGVPPTRAMVDSFRCLSSMIGPDRVIWRYDPVILTDQMDVPYHLRRFEELATMLDGWTSRCTFSFLDLYPKVRRHMDDPTVRDMQETHMLEIAKGFSQSARKHRLQLATCAETVDLGRCGIAHGACIDPTIVEGLLGCPIRAQKDRNQRGACGCIESIDIGSYDCCPHGCIYCYATSSSTLWGSNGSSHDPKSPVLLGHVPQEARIMEWPGSSIRDDQMKLF